MELRAKIGGVAVAVTALLAGGGAWGADAASALAPFPDNVSVASSQREGDPAAPDTQGLASCQRGLVPIAVGASNAAIRATQIYPQSLYNPSTGSPNIPDAAIVDGHILDDGLRALISVAECAPASLVAGSKFVSVQLNDHRDPGPLWAISGTTVSCGPGFIAFGGGGNFERFSDALEEFVGLQYISSPTSDGTGWTYGAAVTRFEMGRAPSSGAPISSVRTVGTVSTFCLPRSRVANLTVQKQTFTATNNANRGGSQLAGYTNCPAGTGLLSAGVSLTPPTDKSGLSAANALTFSYPVIHPSVNPSGTSWYANAFSSYRAGDVRTSPALTVQLWCAQT